MQEVDLIIKNAEIVNEGSIRRGTVVVNGGNIVSLIYDDVTAVAPVNYKARQVVDATGLYLLPGVIDGHVHFRDPGLTEKADFYTESRAAVAGGVTSVIDMPNTVPPTTTLASLADKEHIAATKSVVNYGFMLGATRDNIDELVAIDPTRYAAIKVFLGSSTGNMLLDDESLLNRLFEQSPKLIVAHCEDESIIRHNQDQFRVAWEHTEQERAELHPKIRTVEACYVSTYKAIARARRYGTRLHVAHVSTAAELDLLSNFDLKDKKITAEVTPNHLWFDDRDYAQQGNRIKCNPAIKRNEDRLALWAGLYDGLLDTIGSDHAPHTWAEKQRPYFSAPAGIPSIQHTLMMMLESAMQMQEDRQAMQQQLLLVVEKMAHNPATLFGIERRGFIREGYHADLVLVNPHRSYSVSKENLYYKCGWSPLEGLTFHSRVELTVVNGEVAYDVAHPERCFTNSAQPLQFEK